MRFINFFKKIFNTKDKLYCFAVFAWPFVYFFRYVLFLRKIGNDFSSLYYTYKVYLLANLSRGQLPWWSPSEGCGFSFWANPFSQVFYPLNLLLLPYYALTHGYSKYEHQLFTILGIAIFAVGLYLWLRKLNFSEQSALFSTLLVSMNYKLGEILRFPNAVHAAAWLPYILLGCTLALYNREQKKAALLIAGSTLMLLTAGYPYYIYYALFLIVPYGLLLYFSKTRLALTGKLVAISKKYLLTVGSALLFAVIICSPYLLKINQLMSLTVDRGGHSLAYSTGHIFSPLDTIGSLIYPPAAQAEGWFFLSFIGLFVIILYLLNLIQKSFPKHSDSGFPTILMVWMLVISLITYGKYSPLFQLLWHYLPGFSALRTWGRLNIILLPLLALLLAKAYAYLTDALKSKNYPTKFAPAFRVFTLIYAAILIAQLYLLFNRKFDFYWQTYFARMLPGAEYLFIITGLISFFILLLVIFNRNNLFIAKHLFLILFITATIDLGLLGSIQWSLPGPARITKIFLDSAKITSTAFFTPRLMESHTISLDSTYYLLPVPNWYYQSYVTFLQEHQTEPEALNYLLGVKNGQRLFFSTSLEHHSVAAFLQDAQNNRKLINITSPNYTGDQLELMLNNKIAGYLCFIDNWDPDWSVIVNGQPTGLEKLFNTFKAVKVSPGNNRIRFLYKPRFL